MAFAADLGKLLEPVGGGAPSRSGLPAPGSANAGDGAAQRGYSPTGESSPGVVASLSGQPGSVAKIIRTQGSNQLTEFELVEAIRNDLPKRFDIEGELRVTLASRWNALQLPDSDFFAECVQLPPGGLSSNMSVLVRGVSGGKIVGEWPLQIRVQVLQKVWVATQRLEAGQVLERGFLAPYTVDVLRETSQPIVADRELVGFELAKTVNKGRALTRRDLVERSLVKRGQFVDAVAGEGGFSIRMRALAMEGGPAGAVIRVKNLDSNKEFYAQVINENQVKVRF